MKKITTKEKIVFIVLLIVISSVAKAAEMKMAFSNTLIILLVIFLTYKFIVSKLRKKSYTEDKPDSIGAKMADSAHRNLENKHSVKKNDASIRPSWMLSVTVLALGTFLFYWFQLRPAQIKHSCSWIKEYVGGEPARPAMSEKEARSKGLLKDCSPRPLDLPNSASGNFLNSLFTPEALAACEKENQRLILTYSTPRSAIPAKERVRKTTDNEYKFCLRDQGL